MITQSSFRYWDRTVEYFDAIYSGEGRTFLGRWLDGWLRRDIYVRVAETARLVDELGAAQTVLDIGTGTGRLCVPLALAGHRVIGIDFSKEMLGKAERVTGDAGVRDRCQFFHADILQGLPDSLNDYKPCHAVAILGVFDYISDALPVLQTARQFEPKRIVASFPRSGTLRSALRQWRYRLQRLDCPLFFYSSADVARLASEIGAKRTSSRIIGQLYFVCFDFQ